MKYCESCRILIPESRKICGGCGTAGISKLNLSEMGDVNDYNLKDLNRLSLNNSEYGIEGIIGSGGYGVILKVKRISDGTRFAMKIPLGFLALIDKSLKYSDSELKTSEDSIEGESNVFRTIEGERLLKLEDSGMAICNFRGREKKFPSILLELAEGTLKDLILLESEGRIKPGFDEKINIARQIIEDLKYLHDKNVVHRDIALENIFVVERDDEINFVLGDFGTSKVRKLIERSTSTKIIGKEKYLDPARFNRKYRSDPRIDMFTAGIVITEVFIGDLWDNIIYEPLSEMNFEEDFLKNFVSAHIDRKIIKFIAKSLKPEIEKRYRNTDEMRKKFEKAVGNQQKKRSRFKITRELKIIYNVTFPFKTNMILKKNETDYENHQKLSFCSDEKLVINLKGVSVCKVRIYGANFINFSFSENRIELSVNFELLSRYMDIYLDDNKKNDKGIMYFQNRMKFSYLIGKTITR